MKIGIIKRIGTVVLMIGTAVVSQASVLVNEGFNGAMPVAGWTFTDNGAVLTNDGPESAISDVVDGKSLIIDVTSDGVPAAINNFSVSGVDTGLAFRISFDYNPADYSLAQHAFMLKGNAAASIAIQLALCADGAGAVKNHSGGSYGSSLGTLAQGEWYHVEIVTVPQNNAGTDTYDLTITDTNGTEVVSETGLGFRTDVTTYDEARWYFNTLTGGNDGAFYIDNVEMKTTTVDAPTNMTFMIDQDFNDNSSGFTLSGDIADLTGPESTLTGIGDGVGIRLHDVTNASNPYADAAIVVDNADEPFNVVFDVNINNGVGENISFRLRDDGASTDGILLTLNFFDGSGVYNHNGSGNDPLGVVLDEQQWYRVWITASDESKAVKTYNLTIYNDSGSVVTNIASLPFKANIASYDSIRWFFNNAVSGRGDRFYVDNVFVGTTLPGPVNPASLWSDWLEDYSGSMGSLTNLNDDADGDFVSNLAEYGLGGDPSDSADAGNLPSSLAGAGYLEYVYYMRNDAAARGLSYWLETNEDLVAEPGWTNAFYEVIGTNTATGISGFDAVTNRISTEVKSQQFINLRVEFTP